MTIKLSDIKPVGNFESVLQICEEKINTIVAKCHEEKQYNKALANFIKLIVSTLGITTALEDGIKTKDIWNEEEAKMDLLFTHILIIKANDCAHFYLNNMTLPPVHEQLNSYIESHKDVFGDLVVEK